MEPLLEFSHLLKRLFPHKVQKISIHGGFTCPNRDGSKGRGGCSYCNNQSFSGDLSLTEESVTAQLDRGIRFFATKYPEMRYLAYFQTYTSSYGSLSSLIARYEEALAHPSVVGLIIGTRPDCMPEALLEVLAAKAKDHFVMVEYGVESTLDRTLRRINRGHTFAETVETIQRTAAYKIPVGAHLILGLPGESREEMLAHADRLASLPLTTLKLHQLQIVKDTPMAAEYIQHPERFTLFTVEEYLHLLLDFLPRLPRSIALDRFISQAPPELLLSPDWGIKNHVFSDRLRKRWLTLS